MTWEKRATTRQFARFLAVGGLNTAFGYGVFALLLLAGLSYPYALLAATIAGVLFNFVTIGGVVFQSMKTRRLARFVLVYGFLYALNLGVLKGLIALKISPYTGQAALMPFLAMLSFYLNKRFVFTPRT
jgi:putative flippase GtrA